MCVCVCVCVFVGVQERTSARAFNAGSRIDYVLVSKGLLDHVISCEILTDLPWKVNVRQRMHCKDSMINAVQCTVTHAAVCMLSNAKAHLCGACKPFGVCVCVCVCACSGVITHPYSSSCEVCKASVPSPHVTYPLEP